MNTTTANPDVSCSPATPQTTERRRSPRKSYIIDAFVGSPLFPAHRHEAVTLNLSRDGVAFQIDTPLSVGSQEILEISLNKQKLTLPIQVRRCRQVERGFWEIGAEFC